MTAQLFNGSSLILQDDLLHSGNRGASDTPMGNDIHDVPLDRLTAKMRQTFTTLDNEGALLVIEIDKLIELQPERQAELLDHVVEVTRQSIRRSDILSA